MVTTIANLQSSLIAGSSASCPQVGVASQEGSLRFLGSGFLFRPLSGIQQPLSLQGPSNQPHLQKAVAWHVSSAQISTKCLGLEKD